jgi:hypothetical protein
MVDGVDKVPKFHSAVAAALQRRRQDNPGGSMGVLTTILADARHISFNIARLKGAFVERWVEKLNQFVVVPHQSVFNRVHCRLSPCGFCCPGNDRPGLWDGVDLAFIVLS